MLQCNAELELIKNLMDRLSSYVGEVFHGRARCMQIILFCASQINDTLASLTDQNLQDDAPVVRDWLIDSLSLLTEDIYFEVVHGSYFRDLFLRNEC